MAWPFPAAVAWDVIPVLPGCPVLIKHTDLPEDLPHQELPLPEVCLLFTRLLVGQTDVLLYAQGEQEDTHDLNSPGPGAPPPAQLTPLEGAAPVQDAMMGTVPGHKGCRPCQGDSVL